LSQLLSDDLLCSTAATKDVHLIYFYLLLFIYLLSYFIYFFYTPRSKDPQGLFYLFETSQRGASKATYMLAKINTQNAQLTCAPSWYAMQILLNVMYLQSFLTDMHYLIKPYNIFSSTGSPRFTWISGC